MSSYKIFHASIFLVIVTSQFFGPSHQLSLKRKNVPELSRHELGHRQKRSRIWRPSDEEDTSHIIGSWPAPDAFVLSLQTKENRHFCSAAIIAPHLALTAAHCFDKFPNPASTGQVVAGKLDLRVKHEREQIRGIKRVHIHENYTSNLDNDIALIELDEPLSLHRRVVDKIEWKTWPSEIFDGEEATAFGWGLTNSSQAHILQKVNLPILSNSTCRKILASTNFTITDSIMCAGQGEYTNIKCAGDSGGPLVIDSVLVGIVSSGLGCAKDHAGVYTRVNAFIPWIQSKMYL